RHVRIATVVPYTTLFRSVPEASLATEWNSDDLTTWVLKLRQGVTFHNGKTLSPADVIYSLNHHRGEESKSAARSLVSAITDIKRSEEHTSELQSRENLVC